MARKNARDAARPAGSGGDRGAGRGAGEADSEAEDRLLELQDIEDELRADELRADELQADELRADELQADELQADELPADELDDEAGDREGSGDEDSEELQRAAAADFAGRGSPDEDSDADEADEDEAESDARDRPRRRRRGTASVLDDVDSEDDEFFDIGEGDPSGRVPKTERILNLIAFLLRAREPVPVEGILAKVRGFDDGASRESLMRRFERDKRVLREMGVPLQFISDRTGIEGYVIPHDSYYLGEATLTPHVLALLRAIAAAGDRSPGGRLREDLRSAMIKLGFDAGPLQSDVVAGADSLANRHLDLKVSSSVEAARLEMLAEAVLLRRRVRFTYYTISRDQTSDRRVSPYGLGFAGQGWHKGAWYLVGWCHSREAIRVFKIDRIRSKVTWDNLRDGGSEFSIPADFKVSEHLARPRWELSDLSSALRGPEEPSETVSTRVAIDSAVVSEVLELIPKAELESRSQHEAIVRLNVRLPRPFFRFLLRYQSHIRILEPASLDAEFRAFAREVLAKYRRGDG